jgi:hypothetical protein
VNKFTILEAAINKAAVVELAILKYHGFEGFVSQGKPCKNLLEIDILFRIHAIIIALLLMGDAKIPLIHSAPPSIFEKISLSMIS